MYYIKLFRKIVYKTLAYKIYFIRVVTSINNYKILLIGNNCCIISYLHLFGNLFIVLYFRWNQYIYVGYFYNFL